MTEIRALHRLAALPLFARLDEPDLALLVDTLVRRAQVAKGSLLYLQAEYDRSYYVLDRGAARLLRVESDGVERVVRELRIGQAVGENALLVGESRDVSLEATGDSSFFVIEHAAFATFCADRPDIAARLAPRPEVSRRQGAPRLSWQRSDEVLIRAARASGWSLTTRRLVHQDVLGRRQVVLRRVRDVRARPAWPVGRWLDVGRVEVLVQGGRRLVWRGVAHPQQLADVIFLEVGRDQTRAHAEALARARRALAGQGDNLPPQPLHPQPDPLLDGESDWLAMGVWWLADRLSAGLLSLIGRQAPLTPMQDDDPIADAAPGEEASRSSHERSL